METTEWLVSGCCRPIRFGLFRTASEANVSFGLINVNIRLAGRFIPRETIVEAVETLELVESYPDDKYLPSYLVLGRAGTDAFHVLVAADVGGDNVRIVTAYRPDVGQWRDDLRTRRSMK